jgi:hypothetical protein
MSTSKITMKSTTPILRIFDEEKAKEFYLKFLEFKLDWEHRFEDDLPLSECSLKPVALDMGI